MMTCILLRIRIAASGLGLMFAAACAPSALIDVAPPNSVADPSVVATATGATQLYSYAVTRLAVAVGGNNSGGSQNNIVAGTGVFTDELMRVEGSGNSNGNLDDRNNINSIFDSGLPATQVEARQAREALRLYAPATPVAWQARLQAVEGYAIVLMAEVECSGWPLATIPLGTGSPAITRGFTTQELLQQAITLFDSAVTLAGDSTRFRYLAEIGKGRALLDLGRFADAATAVADVPTGFVYFFYVGTSSSDVNPIGNKPQSVQVKDNEGGNGLAWSADPRTAIVTTPGLSGAMLVPAKYSVTTSGTINATAANPIAPTRGADGLEARLIEAEAALAQNDASWLAKLNALRAACIGTAACAPVPGLTAASLSPLADPGAANTRLDLVMKERAMWLYLTGHREGDLRRLAHVYQRDPTTLWPMGLYINPGFPPLIAAASNNGTVNYANVWVNAKFSGELSLDQAVNPQYTGCDTLDP